MADITQGLTGKCRVAFEELGAIAPVAAPGPDELIQALRHPTVEGFNRWAAGEETEGRDSRQPV